MADSDHRDDIDLGALYRDTVLDHYRAPRGHKVLDRIDLVREGHNPLCGDRLTMSVKLANGKIDDVAVNCKGCAISIASSSMLAEMLPGKSLDEAKLLAESFRQMMHGQSPPEGLDMGDLDALEGVRNFPVRVKCALLAWMTLIDALRAMEGGGDARGGVTVTENDRK